MNPQQLIKEYREEFIKVYFEDVEPIEKDLVNRPDNIADWWIAKMSQSILKFIDQEIERLRIKRIKLHKDESVIYANGEPLFRQFSVNDWIEDLGNEGFNKAIDEDITYFESLKEELSK